MVTMAARLSSQEDHTCKGHVQIVCKRQDQLALQLHDDLMRRLDTKGFTFKTKEELGDDVICPGAVIVVCVRSTNILQNVNEATTGFEDKINKAMALIIMHGEQGENGENESQFNISADILSGRPRYDKPGVVLDFTFKSSDDKYMLDSNIEMMQRLEKFLEQTLCRNTCSGCAMPSSTTPCVQDTVQLYCDDNKRPLKDLLPILIETLKINGVTAINVKDKNLLKIDEPTIFMFNEGFFTDRAVNGLLKYINERGFTRTTIIVLVKNKNSGDYSHSVQFTGTHVFRFATTYKCVEKVDTIDVNDDVLNDILLYLATEKNEAQSQLPNTLLPTMHSQSSLQSLHNNLGPVQVYCKRNDQTATDITGDLVNQLRNRTFDCSMKEVNDLNHSEPAIVICFKTSRILANVSEGLVDIKEKLSDKKILIIFHLTQRDVEAVDEAGADLLGGYADYRSLGLVLDMTYRNDEQKSRFCLNQNTVAFKNLESNIKRLNSQY